MFVKDNALDDDDTYNGLDDEISLQEESWIYRTDQYHTQKMIYISRMINLISENSVYDLSSLYIN